MMHRDRLRGLLTINEIADHAQYFLAVCLEGSVKKGADEMGATPRTVLNHIKWLQCLIGEKLLQEVLPGQTMQLSVRGREIANYLADDFFEGVRKLDANKMNDVVGQGFMNVVKDPKPYTKQTPADPISSTEKTEETNSLDESDSIEEKTKS